VDAAVVLAVVALALLLFWTEWVPIEVTSLVVVFLLAVTGVLSPEEAFSGFANDTVVFIFALLAMTQGLASTGVVRAVAGRLSAMGRLGPRAFLVAMMVVVASFSAFVSNTVTTAAFLPVVMGGASRVGLRPREVLMPMAFASMLGGTILLYGTSTNLVMSAVMSRAGLAPLGVLELAPVGLPLTAVGIVLVALVAPRLLRTRGEEPADEALHRRDYVAEVAVPADSPHVGRPLEKVAQALGARTIGVVRGSATVAPRADERVAPDDRVLIEGERDEIVQAADAHGVEVPGGREARPARGRGAAEGLVVVEATVPPGSRLAGRSVDEARFAQRLGIELLAIHRRPAVQRVTKMHLLGRLLHAPRL
jgi:di/tricarboxylate transporter